MSATKRTVLVTGASGLLGREVVLRLLRRETEFHVLATVRSDAKAKALRQFLRSKGMDKEVTICCMDATVASSVQEVMQAAKPQSVFIATSSVPKVLLRSLPRTIFRKVMGDESARPAFCFPAGGSPREVDYEGQKLQIDAASAVGVRHIVLVSSMGGTDPSHFINQAMEKVALWKRKAEVYLINSKVPYTIMHAGQLLPRPPKYEPAAGGQHRLLLGFDDRMLESSATIPREDLAAVVTDCLASPDLSSGRSFDISADVSKRAGIGEAYGAYGGGRAALENLLECLHGANCNYDDTISGGPLDVALSLAPSAPSPI